MNILPSLLLSFFSLILIAPIRVNGDDGADTLLGGFRGLVNELKSKYPYTEWRRIDWDEAAAPALSAIAEAEAASPRDYRAYYDVVLDFCWRIHDGHVACFWNDDEVDPGTGESCADVAPWESSYVESIGHGYGVRFSRDSSGEVRVTDITNFPTNSVEEGGVAIWDRVIEVDGIDVEDALEAVQLSQIMMDDGAYPATSVHIDTERLAYLARSGPDGILNLTVERQVGGDTVETSVTLTSSAELMMPTRESSQAITQEETSSCVSSYIHEKGSPSQLKVGVLGISSFAGCWFMRDAVRKAVRKFKAEGVAAVIIDMRGNSGGDDDKVPHLLGAFVDEAFAYETIALPTNEGGFEVIEEYTAEPFKAANRWDGPVAVLVNRMVISNGDIATSALVSGPTNATVFGFEGTSGSVSLTGNEYQDLPCFYIEFTMAQSWLPGTNMVHLEANQSESGQRIGGVLPTNPVKRSYANLVDFKVGDPVLDAALASFTGEATQFCDEDEARSTGIGGCCYTAEVGKDGSATYGKWEDVGIFSLSGTTECPCSKRFDAGVPCHETTYVNSGGLSDATIAGIAVAGAIIVLGVSLFFICRRTGGLMKTLRNRDV